MITIETKFLFLYVLRIIFITPHDSVRSNRFRLEGKREYQGIRGRCYPVWLLERCQLFCHAGIEPV
ncbi:MAG: hypothetical protein J6X42_04505, partial [Alphaproteobacteria bacterium]|nr:hypothetical protein [Alphaproteobacteria bacterium]